MTQGFAKAEFADPGWQSWTPSWVNLTVGNGTVIAQYTQVGTTVTFFLSLVWGSTTSMSGAPRATLPVNADTVMPFAPFAPVGVCVLKDDTGDSNQGFTAIGSATEMLPREYNVAGTLVDQASVNANSPFVWATADVLFMQGTYQAATSLLIGMGLNNDHGSLSGLTDDDHIDYARIITQRSEPSDSGDLAAGVSETELGSLTLVIPTTWNTYDIEAYHKADITDRSGLSSTTGDRFNFRVRFTNTSGAQIGPTLQTETQNNNALDNQSYLNMVFVEGQTTTGNVEIICSVEENASGWVFSVKRQTFIVKAFRVT